MDSDGSFLRVLVLCLLACSTREGSAATFSPVDEITPYLPHTPFALQFAGSHEIIYPIIPPSRKANISSDADALWIPSYSLQKFNCERSLNSGSLFGAFPFALGFQAGGKNDLEKALNGLRYKNYVELTYVMRFKKSDSFYKDSSRKYNSGFSPKHEDFPICEHEFHESSTYWGAEEGPEDLPLYFDWTITYIVNSTALPNETFVVDQTAHQRMIISSVSMPGASSSLEEPNTGKIPDAWIKSLNVVRSHGLEYFRYPGQKRFEDNLELLIPPTFKSQSRFNSSARTTMQDGVDLMGNYTAVGEFLRVRGGMTSYRPQCLNNLRPMGSVRDLYCGSRMEGSGRAGEESCSGGGGGGGGRDDCVFGGIGSQRVYVSDAVCGAGYDMREGTGSWQNHGVVGQDRSWQY